MDLSPRQVAALSFLALIPIGIYAWLTDHLTLVTGLFSLINIVLIAGSLLMLFGPAPADIRNGTSH